jgi:hypothetical protein
MTRLSVKYVRPLSVCFLVALIPVVVHSYFHLEIDDCKTPWTLVSGSAPVTDVGGKRDAFMRDRFQSSQWQEGSFSQDGLRFDFSIIRSYDAKRLYHRPENSLVEHTAIADKRDIEWARTDSDSLPIHRADYGDTDPAILVSYLLVYHSSPIASPYSAQLRAAPVELISGRRPMTLFLIQAHGSPSGLREMEKVEREWLLSSWDKYRSACAC